MNARTIAYQPHGGVQLTQIDVPEPPPGHVQVQATACGICAWDIHVFQHGSDWHVMPGHEGLGRVIQPGPGVEHLPAGTRVTGHGLGFTERVNLPAHQLLAIPDDGRPDEHWIVEPVSCVITGLDHTPARPGDRVAILGTGFMGLMLIQALAGYPLDQLIALDLDPRRRQLARQLGAHETHDPSSADDQLIDHLHHRAIDTVIDTTGSQHGLELASRIVRPGGTLNLFGWNHGTASFPGDLWHMRGITVVNATPAAALRDPFPPAIRLMARGIINLQPLVTHVVTLDDYPELLHTAARKADGYIKGVVRLS